MNMSTIVQQQHIPVSDAEKRREAQDRTLLYQGVSKGVVEGGLTDEISKIATEAELGLKTKAELTGAKEVGHAADVLEAQRLLVAEKDLADRFLRISNRLKELKARQSIDPSVADFSKQMESLRSLLRLTIRSNSFRETILESIRVFNHIIVEEVEHVAQRFEESQQPVVYRRTQEGFVSGAAEELQRKIDIARENLVRTTDSYPFLSEEDWQKILLELDHFFSRLNSRSEFRRGVREFIDVGSSFVDRVSSLKVPSDRAVDSLQREAEDLVAQFAGEELYTLIRRIRVLVTSLAENTEAKIWWINFKDQIFRLAENYRGKEDLGPWREILNHGRKIFHDYKPKLIKIITSLKTVIENIANDQYVNRLKESLSTLTDDLYWKDQDGNRYFDSQAASILISSIGEVIKEQFKYFALPRISYRDYPDIYVIDNLVLTATLPDKIKFHLETDMALDLSSISIPEKSSLTAEIYITTEIKGISAQAQDMSFTYKGSTISDAGKLDVEIPDADLVLDFVMKPSSHSSLKTSSGGNLAGDMVRYQFLRLKSSFRINDMDIHFHEKTLTHNVLVPMMAKLFKARLIDRFESGIEEALDRALITLGERVVSILNQSPNPLSISRIWDTI